MAVSGLYKITCISDGRYYIGSSTDISRRWAFHQSCLRRGKHENRIVQRTWDKYGEDTFLFEVLFECSAETLIREEQALLNDHYGTSLCMNLAKDASCSLRGYKMPPKTPETLRRMSIAQLGKTLSDAAKVKLSLAFAGAKNPRARVVIVHWPSGAIEEYPCMLDAATALRVSVEQLRSWLKGRSPWPGSGHHLHGKTKHLNGLKAWYKEEESWL